MSFYCYKKYGTGTLTPILTIGTRQRISEIARDMKSPALGDERSEEYLGMQLGHGRLSVSISLNNWDNGLPEPLAVIVINGEGLHTDPKQLLHRINSMKGVKP